LRRLLELLEPAEAAAVEELELGVGGEELEAIRRSRCDADRTAGQCDEHGPWFGSRRHDWVSSVARAALGGVDQLVKQEERISARGRANPAQAGPD
jgi:hypothetical protein